MYNSWLCSLWYKKLWSTHKARLAQVEEETRKKTKKSDFHELDEALILWFRQEIEELLSNAFLESKLSFIYKPKATVNITAGFSLNITQYSYFIATRGYHKNE